LEAKYLIALTIFLFLAIALISYSSFTPTTGMTLILGDQNITQDLNGATDFNGLTDTPASYAGAGGKCVAVKGTEDGLEFIVCGVGGGITDTNFMTFADFNSWYVSWIDGNKNYWTQIDLNTALQISDFNNVYVSWSDGNSNYYTQNDLNSLLQIPDFNNVYVSWVDGNLNYYTQIDLNNLLQIPDFNGMIINLGETRNWNLDTNAQTFCNAGEVLFGDGTCGEPINALSSFYFPTDLDSDIGGYEVLQDFPDTNSIGDSVIVSSGTGTVLIDQYVTDTNNPFVNVIPAGTYSFFVYASIDSDSGETFIDVNVLKRDLDGVETNFFGVTTPEINGNTATLYGVDHVLISDYDVNVTDRFVVKFYARNNHATAKTITLYYGQANAYTYIRTTLPAGGSSGYVRYTGNVKNLDMGDFNVSAKYFIGNGSELTGIISETDTNWSTAYPIFDANMNAKYAQITDVNGNFALISDVNGNFALVLDVNGANASIRTDMNKWFWKQTDLNSLLQFPDFNGMIINLGEGQGWNLGGTSDGNFYSIPDFNNIFAKIIDMNSDRAKKAYTTDINGTYAKTIDVNGVWANPTYMTLTADWNLMHLMRGTSIWGLNLPADWNTLYLNSGSSSVDTNIFTQGSYSNDTNSWNIDLNVGGNNLFNVNDMNINGDLNVAGNLNIIGDLNVQGNLYIDQNITAQSSLGKAMLIPDQNMVCIGTETTFCMSLSCNATGDCNADFKFI